MSEAGFDVPIALFVFNRPKETGMVLSVISQIKPKKFFIIADGPRQNKDDETLIAQVKDVISKVDWSCEVVTDYSATNLGCNKRLSSGLTTLFSQVDRAIILEDDCVPDISFFGFCKELLTRYENDDRIMSISGNNFVPELIFEADYYFTCYPHCWGWATWARAWQHFDKDMSTWPNMKHKNLLNDILNDRREIKYWSNIFDKTAKGEIDSWAYRWLLTCWNRKALSINPKSNLVSNIGFSEEATHTKTKVLELSELPTHSIKFPLRHPDKIQANLLADEMTDSKIFSGGSLKARALKKMRILLEGFN